MAHKKKKKRRNAKKRKAAKRSNPAPKRRRRRSNPAASAAPQRRRRRRGSRKRSNPGRARRRRRNPSITIMQIGAWSVGGLGAYGAVWGAKKIAASVTNPYAQLAIQTVAPLVVAIPAALFGAENIAGGAFGGFMFQLPSSIMSAYNVYKTQGAQQPKSPGQQGMRGLEADTRTRMNVPATARVGVR